MHLLILFKIICKTNFMFFQCDRHTSLFQVNGILPVGKIDQDMFRFQFFGIEQYRALRHKINQQEEGLSRCCLCIYFFNERLVFMHELGLLCVKNNHLRVLLIDNYDSFTYNIVELLRQFPSVDLDLRMNDEVSIAEASGYDAIILSPGPATPKESGNLLDIITALAPTHPMFGICLGHQAIAQAFGATLRNEKKPFHGFQTTVEVMKPHLLFDGLPRSGNDSNLPTPFKAGLYHSWSVSEADFPSELAITAYSAEGNIMALRHKTYRLHGVQFHPESYMTEYGKEMMANFLGVV